MKGTLLGVKHSDFVDRETGERVVGDKIYYSFKDPDVVGQASTENFVKDGISEITLKDYIGKVIQVDFLVSARGKPRVILVTAEAESRKA